MSDNLKQSLAIGSAIALYAGGAFVGAVGACMMLVMGGVAIYWGAPLVTEIMFAAGISAIGLTIADSGRKKLRALMPSSPGYAVTVIKHAN